MPQFSRQIRFYFHLVRAFVGKYYLLIGLGVISGMISFLLAPSLIRLMPKFRSTLRVAVVGRYQVSEIPLRIQQQISIGLTSISEKGETGPGVAESWKISADGREYTFFLRPGLKWQDGTLLKSQDLNYQFKDVDIQYPDSKTVVIKLRDPYAALPVVLARPVFKSGLLGIGQYRVSTLKKNGQIVEELVLVPANPDVGIPKIQYRFYSSSNLAMLAFKLGLVDTIEELPSADELTNWPNVNVRSVMHKDRYVAVFFNNAKLEKSIRQALAYAINKNRWPDRAIGPIGSQSWVYNPDIKLYDYDLGKAKQLLDKLDKKLDTIELDTLPVYAKTAENIKEDWSKLSIKVDIKVVNDIPEDFTALVLAQAMPLDPDQYSLWHSTQGTNLTRYNSPRVDKLLEDGRRASDSATRRDIYENMQRFLLEDSPAAFLYYQTTYTINRK